jgi:RHS repeat-associated protein
MNRVALLAIAVCIPLMAHAQPPAAGGALVKGLQADLHSLAALARSGADGTSIGSPALDDVAALLDRIRAADLLMQEQQRAVDARLQRTKAPAALVHRQQEHARLFRERLDRLYRASEPLTAGATAGSPQARAAFAAIAEALGDASDAESRTPIGATLPYRSLAWPQVAPQPGAAVTPAYLTTPVPAPQAADLAETAETSFTDAIRARAAALSRDPIAIFEFVQNNVSSEFYYGAMKDASETLRQLSGNDTDHASLLVALLRASDVPSRYVRGVIRLTGAQAIAWTGAGSTRRAAEIFTRAGIPFRPILQGGSIGAFEIEHTWVEAYVPYSNYRGVRLGTIGRAWIPLDPSFKTVDVTPGEDVLAAMGFNAGTVVTNYLSQTQSRAPMDFYREAIIAYLTQTGSPLTFEQALATRSTRASQAGLLPSTLPYSVVSIHGESPELPDVQRHRVRFVAGGEGGPSFDVTVTAAELAGRRLTLSYIPATVDDQAVVHAFLGLDNTPAYLVKLRPVLKIGGIVKAAGSTPVQMGGIHTFTVEIRTPRGALPVVNSVLAGGYYALGLATQPAAYDIPLARAPDDTEHQAADRLYSIAIDYIRRWNDDERTLERLLRVVNVRPALSQVIVGTAHARTVVFGQPQAIEWRGVFVDADLRVAEPVPTGADDTRAREFMRLSGLAGSVLEADVLRLNLGGVDAVSAASVIQLARAGGTPVDEVTAANLAEVLARLQTADIVKTEIADAVNQGWRVTIPARDLARNIWTGIGYVMIDPATGAGGYFISGGLAGGFTTQPPDDWPDQPLAEELAGPNAEAPNTDPAAVRFLTKIALTDRQNGVVNEPLSRELAVWARDGDGRAVEGATVIFVVQTGGGTFDGNTTAIHAVTDRRGIARTPFTLGSSTSELPFHVRVHPSDTHTTQVGQNIVAAFADSSAGPIEMLAPFQQFAYPGPAHHITKVAGDGNRGVPGRSGGTLIARLEDVFDNPIANGELVFNVLPAAAVAGTLPAGAANMLIYPQEPRCPIPTPTLEECSGDHQEQETTSTSGAAVETIFGNTEATTYRVSVNVLGDLLIPTQTFTLTTMGERTFGTGGYAPPMLTMSVAHLLNDRGELINSGPVGTLLGRPLEVRVYTLEDDYTLVETDDPCTENPGDPPCWRVQSRETKRVRLIGRNIPGSVTFPRGGGNQDVTAPRQSETAAVVFTPVTGGGHMTSTETPGIGRYAASLFLGPEPALNIVDADLTATMWVPCFDLNSGQFPVVARLATGVRADQILLNQFQCARGQPAPPPLFQFGPNPPVGIYRQAAFGVRAAVTPTVVHITPNGVATETTRIPFLIEPVAPVPYDAATAELDLFTTESNGLDTWLGYLPARPTHGAGEGLLLQGTQLDPDKPHRAQLVLNRGTAAEIRSEKTPLQLAGPTQLTASPGVIVRSYVDRVNQSVCQVPSDGLFFFLTRDARITIRVDGNILQNSSGAGSVVFNDLLLERGLHTASIAPAHVSSPGLHSFTITAVFPGVGGLPDETHTASGPVIHEIQINGTLPVGHTVVEGVDLATGQFGLTREDLAIPGIGPRLEFRRNYSSAGVRSTGAMGAGWSHNYQSRIVADPCGTLTLIGGEGSGMRFDAPITQNGVTTFTPQVGFHGVVTRTEADNAYDYYTPQRTRYHYESVPNSADASAPVLHRLAYIEDTNGNRLSLSYDVAPPFNLTRVTDAAGRSLSFTYQLFGLVPEPRLTSIQGPLNLSVTFEYDTQGNLRRATRGPRTERYEYDESALGLHNIVRIFGPNNALNEANDITELTYHTAADSIPGRGTNTPEPWEMVKTITAGADTADAATHQYAFNFATHQTTVLDPRATPTRYTMDPHHGAVTEKRVVLATGDQLTLTRWAFQDGVNDVLMTQTTDPLGRVTTYAYDAKGNPTSTTIRTSGVPYAGVARADGTSVTDVTAIDTFDPTFGRLTRSQDPEGRVTDYAIDGATGNVQTMTTYPGGGAGPLVTRNTYATANGLRGLLKSVTDPRDKTTTYDQFDNYGNATRVIDAEGNVTTHVFDERSRLRESHDTVGRHRTFDYDELDRVTSITDTTLIQPADVAMASTPDRRTTTTYTPAGQPITVTNGLGHVTRFEYDARNRQVLQREVVADAAGGVQTLESLSRYDENGNRIHRRDPRGLEHHFEFDFLNRMTVARVNGQTTASRTYDAAGNVLTETDLHGHVTAYDYDALYRRIRTRLPLAPFATTTTYDLVGNILRETDANNHGDSRTYDGVDRLIGHTNVVGIQKRFEYDGAGNRTLDENVTSGLRVYTDYDGLNRPVRMRQEFTDPLTSAPTVYTTLIQHLDAAHTKVTTSPRGVISRERFNGHDALIERTIDAGPEAQCTPAPEGPACLQTTYRYDGNGNLTAEKDSVGGVVDKESVYDGLNRKIVESLPLGGTERVFYDGNGNIVREIDRRGVETITEYDHLDREIRRTVTESISNGGQPLVVVENIFDDQANALTIRDGNRHETRQQFDAMHRPIRRLDPLGQALRLEWDGVFKTAEIDEVRGIRTELDSDALGRTTARRVITSAGPVTARVEHLDGQNRRLEFDANGVVTTIHQQDPLGRTRRVSKSAAALAAAYGAAQFAVEDREYDGHNNLTAVVDANGNRTAYTYDGGDRQVRITEGAGSPQESISTMTYDRADNLLTIKDGRPHDRPFDVRYTYDLRNRKVLAEDGSRAVAAYQYDQDDRLAAVIEPNGATSRTVYTYDEFGAVLAIDETRGGAGGVTRFLYDAQRNRIAQQDANGNLTTYRHDALNRVSDMFQHAVAGSLADARPRSAGAGGDESTARRWQYRYDSGGNQTRIVDAAGQIVLKEYNELNREVRRTYSNHQPDAAGNQVFPQPVRIEYAYDTNGNLTRVDEFKQVSASQTDTETTIYDYDPLDRVVRQATRDNKVVRLEYDRAGNQTAIVDADSNRTTYAFDAKNRPISASEGSVSTLFNYWPDDLMRSVVHPNGMVAETTYDAADRVTAISNRGLHGPVSSYAYSYDANGNRLTQLEQHSRLSGGASTLTTYSYDAANRVIAVDYPGAATVSFTYSPNGNRLTETGISPETSAPIARSYTYDRFNQLRVVNDTAHPDASVAIRYDSNGNTVEQRTGLLDGEGDDVPSPVQTQTFSWNIRDFLARSSGLNGSIAFDYDFNGRRSRMTGPVFDIRYLADARGVIQEYDAASLNTTLRYGRGPGGPFSLTTAGANPARFVFVTDVLGSTSELTDQSGTVQASYSYDSFGKVLQHFDLTPNRRTYTGHYRDDETGLLYMGARYANVEFGRFLSQDPFHGDIFVPASLNRFSYAHNNPLIYVDPDGRFINLAAAGIGFVAGGSIGCAVGVFTGNGCLKGAAVGAAAGGLAGLTFGASMALTGGSFLISSTVAGAAGGYTYSAGNVIAEGGTLREAHEQGTIGALLGAVGGATGGVFLEAGVGLTGAEMLVTEFVAGFAESAGSQLAGMTLGSQDSFSFTEALVSGGSGASSPVTGRVFEPAGRFADQLGITAGLMTRPRLVGKEPTGVLTFRGANALAATCLDAGCAHYGGLGGKSVKAFVRNVAASVGLKRTDPRAPTKWKKTANDQYERNPDTGLKIPLKQSNDLDWAVFGKGDYRTDRMAGIKRNAEIGAPVLDTIHGELGPFLKADEWIPDEVFDPQTGQRRTGIRDAVTRQYGDAIFAADYWLKGIHIGGGKRVAPLTKNGQVVLRALDPHSFAILRGPSVNPRFRLFWMQVPQVGEEDKK